MTTNYEKIKNMSIEELANFLDSNLNAYFCPQPANCIKCGGDCEQRLIEWLQQETKDKDE